MNFKSTCPLSSAYLVVRLGVDWGAPLCALQRLLHLLHLDGQMGFKVPAQRHAGVLGRLPAGENLVITQQRPLVLGVQDFKCADLEAVAAQQKGKRICHAAPVGRDSDLVRRRSGGRVSGGGLSYQVDEASQAILLVEQLQDGTKGKGDGEEHGGVAAAGGVRAFQQPQRVADHV